MSLARVTTYRRHLETMRESEIALEGVVEGD